MNFEIMVLGDLDFMYAVLNGISGFTGYKGLATFGFILGLLYTGVKAVLDPSKPMSQQMSWILTSLVIWMALFGYRVDGVVIRETTPAPGNTTPRVRVVDNVPAGLAALGSILNNLTFQSTRLFEQSMSTVDDEQRVLNGGVGGNMMAISRLRDLMLNDNFTDGDGTNPGVLGQYRANMVRYQADCMNPILANGSASISEVYNSSLEDGVFSSKFAHGLRYTKWFDAAGKESFRTCKQAHAELKQISTSGDKLSKAFDQAAQLMGESYDSKSIARAFGGYFGDTGQEMQRIMALSIFNATRLKSQQLGSIGASEAQSIMMTEEAAHRRAIQNGGEENLFVRILKPLTSFFEALFYALAPIMAFVICLGPAGVTYIGKYAMMTLWVAMWYPMLVITHLYSQTTMGYFTDKLYQATGGLQGISPVQLNELTMKAIEALGVASTLTAATPALAMSILSGGAVSMSYLAGRLQGSDMIDENKVAPQAQTVAPVSQVAAASQSRIGEGTTVGGNQTQYQLSDVAEQQLSSARQVSAQSTDNFMSTVTKGSGFTLSSKMTGSQGDTFNGSKNTQEAVAKTFTEAQMADWSGRFTQGEINSAQNALAVEMGARTPVVTLGGSASAMDSKTRSLANEMATSANQSIATNTADSYAIGSAAALDFKVAKDNGWSSGNDAKHEEALSRQAGYVESSSVALSEMQGYRNSLNGTETTNAANVAKRLEDSGQIGALNGLGVRAFGEDDWQQKVAAYKEMGDGATDGAAQVAAMNDLLSQTHRGYGIEDTGAASEARSLLAPHMFAGSGHGRTISGAEIGAGVDAGMAQTDNYSVKGEAGSIAGAPRSYDEVASEVTGKLAGLNPGASYASESERITSTEGGSHDKRMEDGTSELSEGFRKEGGFNSPSMMDVRDGKTTGENVIDAATPGLAAANVITGGETMSLSDMTSVVTTPGMGSAILGSLFNRGSDKPE